MKWLSRGAIFSYIHFLFIGSLSFEALSLQVTMQLPVNWLGCSEDIEGKNLSSWPAVFSNSNFYEVRGFLEWTILTPTQALTMPVPPISHIWSPAGVITGYPIKTIWVNPRSFWLFSIEHRLELLNTASYLGWPNCSLPVPAENLQERWRETIYQSMEWLDKREWLQTDTGLD